MPRQIVKDKHNFNSIKVRLEQYGFHTNVATKPNFNSIKVRLEPLTLKATNPIDGDFNSIKVRLEPEAMRAKANGATFQFHKGTIRTP